MAIYPDATIFVVVCNNEAIFANMQSCWPTKYYLFWVDVFGGDFAWAIYHAERISFSIFSPSVVAQNQSTQRLLMVYSF